MNKDFIHFEIKPIFSPSMEICENFANIHISHLSVADQEKLNFYKNAGPDYFKKFDDETKLSALIDWNRLFSYTTLNQAYFNTWDIENHVFAFAAYKGKEMVGFITGALTGINMFTRSLYVIPQYRGYGIGSKLLETAERTASFVATKMELFSLSGSVSFYHERGYKNTVVCGKVMKTKKLSKISAGTVPVFQWFDSLQSKLNVEIDTNLLKQSEYQPIFVYVNSKQNIDGIATRLPDGKKEIRLNDKQKHHWFELSYALDNCR